MEEVVALSLDASSCVIVGGHLISYQSSYSCFLQNENPPYSKKFSLFLEGCLNQGTSKHTILARLGNGRNTVSTGESLPILMSLEKHLK